MEQNINGQTMPKSQNAAIAMEDEIIATVENAKKYVDIFDESLRNARQERLSHKRMLNTLGFKFDSLSLHRKEARKALEKDLLSPGKCLNAANRLLKNGNKDVIDVFEACGLFKLAHDENGKAIFDENGIPKVALRKATFDDLLSKPVLNNTDGTPKVDENGKEYRIFCTLTTTLKDGESLAPYFQRGEKLYFLRPFTKYSVSLFLSSIKDKHKVKMFKYDDKVKELNRVDKQSYATAKAAEKAEKEAAERQIAELKAEAEKAKAEAERQIAELKAEAEKAKAEAKAAAEKAKAEKAAKAEAAKAEKAAKAEAAKAEKAAKAEAAKAEAAKVEAAKVEAAKVA